MTDLYVSGRDALELLSDLGVNSFKTFKVDQAKQIVVCNPRGHVIGDAILFYLADESFNIVGRLPVANWVQYHVESGKYDAKAERDERSAQNQGRRRVFRFQIQGPNAVGHGPSPAARCQTSVLPHGHVPDRRRVRALRRDGGPARLGTWAMGTGRSVRDAAAGGKAFGIRQVGAGPYPTNADRVGLIPSPLPAIHRR
jgi:hypothetical protein